MDSDCRDHPDALTEGEPMLEREGSAVGPPVNRLDYDAEVRMHDEVLRSGYDFRSDDHILDIGCGAGQTTRDAARLAVAGTVLGVDVSASMIERARRLTEAAGLRNVTFERADAQIHRFVVERFDVAISRFGTMFFGDPVAAFANIGRAIRPRGRLHMMVWQDHDQNEWSVSIQRAIAGDADVPAASSRAPNAFSLGDPGTTARILESAGFGDVSFTDVHEPVYYGPDVAAAFEWVSGFSCVNVVLQRLDPVSTARTREQLRQTLAAHASKDGVWFDSRAWIVAARRH
jgi:ubiquinone/menaquinone biosynthesis C-methylase UbiE